MARPLSDFGADVRSAIEQAGSGVVTWRSIAQCMHESGRINRDAPAEVALVKRQFEYLVLIGHLLQDGHVPGKTRPLMGYRTAASMQRIAHQSGTRMPEVARRKQQQAAVEQLLLAWGA
jgi:hypothetical protein